jgi:DNA-directed RNA polymerase beta subunit
MNVGQILEVHLGWGAYQLGRSFSEMLESGAPARATCATAAQVHLQG